MPRRSSGTTNDTLARRMQQHGREIRDHGEALAHETHAAFEDLGRVAGERVQHNPYPTLATAFALGWVLGGGLPVGVVRAAVGLGARMAVANLLKGAVQAASESGSDA